MKKYFLLLLIIPLYFLYLKVAITVPVTADYASIVLEAKSFLEGNVILKGWHLTNISFYTTDLPFFVVGMMMLGFKPILMHVVPAFIFTCVLASAVWLTIQKSNKSWIPTIITFILIAFPSRFLSTIMLVSPIHVGTVLMILLAFNALDLKEHRDHLYKIRLGIYLFFMALAVIGDTLAIFVAVLPVIVVNSLRFFRSHDKAQRMHCFLIISLSVLAVILSKLFLSIITHLGGFTLQPIGMSFVTIDNFTHAVKVTVDGILQMFGANFFGQPLNEITTLYTLFHVVIFIIILIIVYFSLRIIIKDKQNNQDPIIQIFLVGMLINLLAYTFSTSASDLLTTRYLIPFFIYTTILVGRYSIFWKDTKVLRLVVFVAGIIYLLSFVPQLKLPENKQPESEVSNFLIQHNLKNGYGNFWASSLSTLGTEGKVTVRSVAEFQGKLTPFLWFAEDKWYKEPANFIVFDSSNWANVNPKTIEDSFGIPVEKYTMGSYNIWIWNKDISALLTFPH